MKSLNTFAGNEWVGVLHGCHDSFYPSFDDLIDARRRPPEVAAWFKADIKRRARGLLSSLFQGPDFSVFALSISVKALADDAISVDQHRSDHGIGAGESSATSGQVQRQAHTVLIRV
jgi:hypothetical protein